MARPVVRVVMRVGAVPVVMVARPALVVVRRRRVRPVMVVPVVWVAWVVLVPTAVLVTAVRTV